MYGIPKGLDLSPIVGEFTTQFRVGPADLQFTIGKSNFSIWSQVSLFRGGKLFASWEAGKWPDPGFYDAMNIEVTGWKVHNDRTIIIDFANGIEMQLEDNSDQYESMEIRFEGNPVPVII